MEKYKTNFRGVFYVTIELRTNVFDIITPLAFDNNVISSVKLMIQCYSDILIIVLTVGIV